MICTYQMLLFKAAPGKLYYYFMGVPEYTCTYLHLTIVAEYPKSVTLKTKGLGILFLHKHM